MASLELVDDAELQQEDTDQLEDITKELFSALDDLKGST